MTPVGFHGKFVGVGTDGSVNVRSVFPFKGMTVVFGRRRLSTDNSGVKYNLYHLFYLLWLQIVFPFYDWVKTVYRNNAAQDNRIEKWFFFFQVRCRWRTIAKRVVFR